LARPQHPTPTELATEIGFLEEDWQRHGDRLKEAEEFVENIQKERSTDIGLMKELETEWNTAFVDFKRTTENGLTHVNRVLTGMRTDVQRVDRESLTSAGKLLSVEGRLAAQQKENEHLEAVIEANKKLSVQQKMLVQQLVADAALYQARIRNLEATVNEQRSAIQHVLNVCDGLTQRLEHMEELANEYVPDADAKDNEEDTDANAEGKDGEDRDQEMDGGTINAAEDSVTHTDGIDTVANAAGLIEQSDSDRSNLRAQENDGGANQLEFLDQQMQANHLDAGYGMDIDDRPLTAIQPEVEVIPPTPIPLPILAPISSHVPAVLHNAVISPTPTRALSIPPLAPQPAPERRRSPRLLCRDITVATLAAAPSTPPRTSTVAHGSPEEKVDFEGSP